MHIVGLFTDSVLLDLFHYLDIIFDPLQLRLEEASLLPHRLNLISIVKQRMEGLVACVEYISEVLLLLLHGLQSVIHVTIESILILLYRTEGGCCLFIGCRRINADLVRVDAGPLPLMVVCL